MIKTALPLIASSMTLLSMWFISQKKSVGWIIGLLNQAIWIAFSISYKALGLLPLNIVLSILYTRALIRWRKDEVIADKVIESLDELHKRG